jgi:hypothetical protein
MIIILMLLYVSKSLLVLYSMSRGCIMGWRERGYKTESTSCNKEIACDFKKVFALNDTIFGQISTVYGIMHLIFSKVGSNCVGVQNFSCVVAGKLCIRVNRDKETSTPHHQQHFTHPN